MQKIRKILRAVSEKTALPTNQPTNHYQQHRSYRTSLPPIQKASGTILHSLRNMELVIKKKYFPFLKHKDDRAITE